jgi:ArsR family transcriptional regulator, arsenate/arsenite/antimonite-responsive transcriptional repressor
MAKALAPSGPVRERGVCCPARPRLRADRADETATVLKALADPTRLQMALILRDADAPVCICDLTATFALSQPTVSHHMAKLREAGLVESTKHSVWSYYRLARDLPPAAKRILAAL